ncbi:MAG TPA: glycosyltransferase [Flavitalea sp.]|nr:glycosyltransferase [Flavitalea sp.]
MQEVIIIGPGYPLRGGLATFDQRLAQQFSQQGYHCTIFSFSLQYPSLFFPGKTQYSTDPAPEGIAIQSLINSVNPFNWLRIGNLLKKKKPAIIVVRYWIPFMAPALGTICRIARKSKHTKVIAITDNIFPHEKRFGDSFLTPYFLKSCDAFITMSEKVLHDLRSVLPNANALQVAHPLYDNFGDPVSPEVARKKLYLPRGEKIILFFGFIRKYKGLDLLLQAMSDPRLANVRLLVAGEFYDDKGPYVAQVKKSGIESQVIWSNEFIPDSEVKYYLCAADVVIQPYRQATQSGVTPLAYHFEKPMIVTNVGSLPSLVPHGKVGLVCEPDPGSIADAIVHFYELGPGSFVPQLRKEKEKYSWSKLVKAITDLALLPLAPGEKE